MKAIILVYPDLWVNAMAIFPFIIVKSKADQSNEVLLNHEKIHFRQQLELLLIPFYLLYLLNYLVNLVRYQNHFKAYRKIVFEEEAYCAEQDLNYLSTRKSYRWLKFISTGA